MTYGFKLRSEYFAQPSTVNKPPIVVKLQAPSLAHIGMLSSDQMADATCVCYIPL